MEADLALIALLVAGYGLVAARFDSWSISGSLVFLVAGIVLSGAVLGLISLSPQAEPVKLLAEMTLTLLLFADASTIRASALRRDVGTVVRLLSVGLLLTMALGATFAYLLFPGISIGMALLIGTTLAPTDAALGQPVVTNPSVPARVRRVLNVESGLNDGIATPFVFLALALATSGAPGEGSWLFDALFESTIGVVVGAVIGAVGGFLLIQADRRQWPSSTSRRLVPLALAVACYLASVSLGGNGFIAAFVGGLAFSVGSRQGDQEAVHFTETEGSLLSIGVWAAFGLAIAGTVLATAWDLTAVFYAVLSLTVIRMLPVALSLIGDRYQGMTVLFIGWFGPRGLASIVFLVVGLAGLKEAGVSPGPLPGVVVWTVLLSVILHGLTAGPMAELYGRRMRDLKPGAPELEDTTEPVPARQWGGANAS